LKMKLIFFCFIALCYGSKLITKEIDHPISIPKDWIKKDRAHPEAIVKLTFAIKQQNLEKLEEILLKVSDTSNPEYGKYLTQEELISLVSPKQNIVQKIERWLQKQGIKDIHLTRGREFLSVKVPIKIAEKLLKTEYFNFFNKITGHNLLRSLGPYYLPEDIANHIDFVGGVIRFPKLTSYTQRKQIKKNVDITPTTIKDLFNIPKDLIGKSANNSQSVAQFLQQYFSPSDLTYFQEKMNLTSQSVAQIIGPNNPNNPGLEASLDIEYIMGVAPNVPTWFVYTDGFHEGQEPFLDWIEAMINTTNSPWVHSVSYGDDENSLTADYMQRINVEFQKFGIMGKSIMFASGDDGVGCDSTCKKFVPNFPATSPYVTAVGGIYWDGNSFFGDSISSGGFSNQFNSLSYQTSAVKQYLSTASNIPSNTYYNLTGRAFPDVSSFSENVIIIVDGGETFVGGTSCASPIFSGIVSLLNDARQQVGKPTLGFLNPFIYKNAKAFTDITEGINEASCCNSGEGFSCSVGWDPVTGVGVPNFPKLLVAALSV